MSEPGIFTISLDFELHWGCLSKPLRNNQSRQQYFVNTRAVIPQMLDLFASRQVHVTWASVGMLFHNNSSEWHSSCPSNPAQLSDVTLSSYEWINKFDFDGAEDVYHFAPSLVNQIVNTPYQELATHTYSHFYCLEKNQTAEHFREDLSIACRLARQRSVELRSLVFPRNQFNASYLEICAAAGITAVRSNPAIWYWKPAAKSSLVKKIFRAADAFVSLQPISKVLMKDISKIGGVYLLPSSRFYYPFEPGNSVKNTLKLSRIIREMTEAAQVGSYYHIWWHPHNFGYHPQACMKELEQVLDHFSYLNKKYGFRSMNMKETAEMLENA